jgi:hypothetical protein
MGNISIPSINSHKMSGRIEFISFYYTVINFGEACQCSHRAITKLCSASPKHPLSKMQWFYLKLSAVAKVVQPQQQELEQPELVRLGQQVQRQQEQPPMVVLQQVQLGQQVQQAVPKQQAVQLGQQVQQAVPKQPE